MNLADADLKHVNTSRPQLVHSLSKQSITASDDYYSLTSEGSGNEGKKVLPGNGNVPSQPHNHGPTQNAFQSEATIPPIRAVKHTQKGSDTSEERPNAPPKNPERLVKRKPVSTSSDNTVRRPLSQVSANEAPTPGVDEAPYVRYALNSLTCDERPYHQETGSEASPSHVARGHDQGLVSKPPQISQGPSDRFSGYTSSSSLDHALVPADPIGTEAFRFPRLNFVPRPLRVLPLSILILCCLLMMAALVYCAVWPNDHQGLYLYDGTGTSRYFVFQYLPQLLAALVVLWLCHIQSAVHRIFPFATMASTVDEKTTRALYDSKLFQTNYLIPDLSYFSHREPMLGVCAIIFWLSLFTIPLQSCLFQTKYYALADSWRWTTVVPIAWTLFAIYLLLVVALLLLVLRFALYQTGLKWDPVCLADIMAMFRQSNILSDFENSEVDPAALHRQRPKSLRIGYWKSSRRESETFYCIGDQAAPLRRYSLEHGRLQSVDVESTGIGGSRNVQKFSTLNTLQSDIHDPSVRYRWLPWFLKDTFVVLWIVIALVLLVAFLVVSYLHNAVSVGFLPLLPAPTTPAGFSPADFLYSFLPAFLGLLMFLVWLPIDQYHRALAPFAALSTPHGVSAEGSLLLDYNAHLPLGITVAALLAGHYRLAWISFVSVLSIALPIIAGGVFTALFSVSSQSVRIHASMPGYIALTVLLVVYALSFLVIWPTEKRRLPHDISTLGQLVSYFYKSPLLDDAIFKEPRGKVDLVTRLLGPPTGESVTAKYAFAVYKGVDGRDHLGIDRFERPVISEKVARSGQGKRQTDWISA